jgi:hypothetical protein
MELYSLAMISDNRILYNFIVEKLHSKKLQFPITTHCKSTLNDIEDLKLAINLLENIQSNNVIYKPYEKELSSFKEFVKAFGDDEMFTKWCLSNATGAPELLTFLNDMISSSIVINVKHSAKRNIISKVVLEEKIFVPNVIDGKLICEDIDSGEDWADVIGDEGKIKYAIKEKSFIRGQKLEGEDDWLFRTVKRKGQFKNG